MRRQDEDAVGVLAIVFLVIYLLLVVFHSAL